MTSQQRSFDGVVRGRPQASRILFAIGSWGLLTALFHLLHSPAAPAQEKPTAKSQAQLVTCEDFQGRTYRGPLLQLSAKQLEIGGEQPARLLYSNLIRVTFADRKSDVNAGGSTVLLDNGDRISLRADATSDEKLVGQLTCTEHGAAISIPLETVRGIALQGSDIPSEHRKALRELDRGRESSDVVKLVNGDRLSGELISLDGAKVVFKGPAGETTVERANVRSIRFSSELVSFPEVSGDRTILILTDGSRITVTNITDVDRERIHVKAAFGGEFDLPIAAVVSLRFLGGSVVDLADLKPLEYQFTPFLSERWPLEQNRNVFGDALVVRGVPYAKGLGMHSGARVSYRLDGRFRQFQSLVAIDDSAKGGGSVRFVVDVDGRRVFESENVRGTDAPMRCGPIDVAGAKQLTLIVEYGEQGDVLDEADWLDPVLLK